MRRACEVVMLRLLQEWSSLLLMQWNCHIGGIKGGEKGRKGRGGGSILGTSQAPRVMAKSVCGGTGAMAGWAPGPT